MSGILCQSFKEIFFVDYRYIFYRLVYLNKCIGKHNYGFNEDIRSILPLYFILEPEGIAEDLMDKILLW